MLKISGKFLEPLRPLKLVGKNGARDDERTNRKTLLLYLSAIILSVLFLNRTISHMRDKTETIVGIGATLGKLADGSIQIIGLIPNSPAEHSGLAKDDFIIEVKSLPNSPVVDVRSLPLADVVALIRGPE